jgi:hypothetical protein
MLASAVQWVCPWNNRIDFVNYGNPITRGDGMREMKKIVSLFVFVLVLFGLAPASVLAAGSATQTIKCYGDGSHCLLTIRWVASTEGTFTSVTIDATKLATLAGYYLYLLETTPGSPTPATYSITLSDVRGDILGGVGASRSTTVFQREVPRLSAANSIYGAAPWITSLTLAITGASTSGAQGIIDLMFVRE